MKRLFILFILFFLYAGNLIAQQIDLAAQQIPAQAQFAQPFDVHFEITHTPGYTVKLDQQTLPEGFSLDKDTQQISSPNTVTYEATFFPFTLGVSTFTAVNFLLQDSNGETVAQAASDPVQIQVSPVKLFKDKNMRDIRPPYIPSGWMWWLLAVILLALAVYFIRRIRRKSIPVYAMKEVPDLRPADVIALDKIQQLLQSGLWEKEQYKLFYSELGNILREYLWRRFRLDVSSDTSAELLRRVRTLPQLTALQVQLRAFLNSADLVKFAKVIPNEATMQQDISHIRTVVETTSPRPAMQTPDQPQEVR